LPRYNHLQKLLDWSGAKTLFGTRKTYILPGCGWMSDRTGKPPLAKRKKILGANELINE
jgi:hypothetical protein